MYLLIIILIGAYIYLDYHNNTSSNKRAIEILDSKFVNGEISEEEYVNKKTLIER
ncbi:MAG: hypothetical protein N2594_06090 [Clostridiales bacterium]|nr:hypothetical protein [Clostridiales bacterium]